MAETKRSVVCVCRGQGDLRIIEFLMGRLHFYL
jgi:hypothetical protein